MIWLSKEQTVMVYNQLMEKTGGSAGIRDENLLISAIEQPLQTFDGIELYPTMIEKAVRLGFGLIMNHAFIDGNKRIGAHTMLLTLKLNGIGLSYSQEELIDIILLVASGERGYDDLLNWVKMKTE